MLIKLHSSIAATLSARIPTPVNLSIAAALITISLAFLLTWSNAALLVPSAATSEAWDSVVRSNVRVRNVSLLDTEGFILVFVFLDKFFCLVYIIESDIRTMGNYGEKAK